MFDKLANLVYEASSLRKLPRAHHQALLHTDESDNISSHSYLVLFIAHVLAKIEKADTLKVLEMAMSHDLAESRTGDLSWVNKIYAKDFEEEAFTDAFLDTVLQDFIKLHKEYAKRETLEAQIVKDADKIAQIVVLKEYLHAYGNKTAEYWMTRMPNFYTNSGKKLAKRLVDISPLNWVEQLKPSGERRK